MPKFIYTDGDLHHYEGYEFMFGRPTEVSNPVTIEKLMHNPLFRRQDEKEIKAPAETKILGQYECPKCGKEFRRGYVMHTKWCKK